MEVLADPNLQNDTIRELYEASLNGCVSTLNTLIQRDPLILSRVSLYPFTETPLHIASLLGHLEFCKVLLDTNPSLGSEVNSEGRFPLHLASAKGHTEVVKALLLTNPESCMVRDKDDMLPLHFAAMRGRLGAIEELIGARPESIDQERIETDDNSVLHLCIQYNHLEALKLLVQLLRGDSQFLCAKDREGNTVLHLAVRRRQIKTIKYLLSLSEMSPALNALNRTGLTALDMFEGYPRDFTSLRIEQILTEAGVRRSAQEGALSLSLNTEQLPDQSPSISEQQPTLSQSLATEQHPVPLLSIPNTQEEEPSSNIDAAQPPTQSSSSTDLAQQSPRSSASIDPVEQPPPLSTMDPPEQQQQQHLSSIDHAQQPQHLSNIDHTQLSLPSPSAGHAQPQPPPLPSTSTERAQQLALPSSGTVPSQPPPSNPPEGTVHTQQTPPSQGNHPPAESTPSSVSNHPPPSPPSSTEVEPPQRGCWDRIEHFCSTSVLSQEAWKKNVNDQLLVAATVIATMTFQSVLSPPGGVWQADTRDGSFECTTYDYCEAGTAIVGYVWSRDFMKFIFFNSTSFFSSLCVVLVIVSGFRLDNRVTMRILTFFMIVALSCMLLTYMWALGLVSPNHIFNRTRNLGYLLASAWLLLLTLIAFIHFTQLTPWLRLRLRLRSRRNRLLRGAIIELLHIFWVRSTRGSLTAQGGDNRATTHSGAGP